MSVSVISENEIDAFVKLTRKKKSFSVENWSWNIVWYKLHYSWKQTISFTAFQVFFLLSVGYHILCQTNVRYTQSQYFVVQWRGMPSIVRNRWITMIKVLNYIAVMHIMMQTKPNLWILWFMPYSQWSVNLTTVCVMNCPTHL